MGSRTEISVVKVVSGGLFTLLESLMQVLLSKGLIGILLGITTIGLIAAAYVIYDKNDELTTLMSKNMRLEFQLKDLEKKYNDLDVLHQQMKESHEFYVDVCDLKNKRNPTQSNEVQKRE